MTNIPKSVTFEGTPSGDGECFCWNVDLDTYKDFDRHWEEEIKYRQEINIEQGYAKDNGLYDGQWKWQVHPNLILSRLDLSNKKHRITITIEEIE